MASQLSTSESLIGRDAFDTSVSPATQKPLEAGAGADRVNGDVAVVALVLEALGHPLRQREDGRAAGGHDVAGDVERIDHREHAVGHHLVGGVLIDRFRGVLGHFGGLFHRRPIVVHVGTGIRRRRVGAAAGEDEGAAEQG